MVRFSVAAVAACVALFFGSAVNAQQTAPAAPPSPPPGYGAPITLDQANTAIAAAMAESKKNGWNHVFAVVGPAGNVIAEQKMDRAPWPVRYRSTPGSRDPSSARQ